MAWELSSLSGRTQYDALFAPSLVQLIRRRPTSQDSPCACMVAETADWRHDWREMHPCLV